MCSKLTISAAIIALFLISVASYKYEVIFDNEEIFSPCDDNPNNYMTNFFNLDKLRFEYISDEEISVDGPLIVVAEIDPTDRFELVIEPEKMINGQWAPTVFTVRRKDFCKTLFSPTELWYQYSSKIRKSERVCPPMKGHIYTISNWTVKVVTDNLPDPYMQGDYKTVLKGKTIGKNNELKRTFCLHIFSRMFKLI